MYDSNNNNSLAEHLKNFVGETVTIYTTSGGLSGAGFTGIIIKVNCDFVRLITRIGPAPSCALGSACCDLKNGRNNDRFGCGVGSVADIPIDRIASFVHNAV